MDVRNASPLDGAPRKIRNCGICVDIDSAAARLLEFPMQLPHQENSQIAYSHQENVNGLTMTCKHLNKIENMPDKPELHVP